MTETERWHSRARVPGSLARERVTKGPPCLRLLLVAWLSALCAGCGVRGSGVTATEARAVDGFFRCRLEGPVQLVLLVDPLTSGQVTLELQGDDNLLPLLETEVRDGTLTIQPAVDEVLLPKQPLILRAQIAELIALEVSASGSSSVTGLDNAHLRVIARGSASMSLGGRTDWLEASAEDTSTLKALSLTADTVTVTASGDARLEVCAVESLVATASDAAVIHYGCEPAQVTESLSGTARLEPLEM